MDTIIKNSKKGTPFQNINPKNEGLTTMLAGEHSQFSNNSAFQIFDPKKKGKVQMEND